MGYGQLEGRDLPRIQSFDCSRPASHAGIAEPSEDASAVPTFALADPGQPNRREACLDWLAWTTTPLR